MGIGMWAMKLLVILCLVYVETRLPGELDVSIFEIPSSEVADFTNGAWEGFSFVTNVFVDCE